MVVLIAIASVSAAGLVFLAGMADLVTSWGATRDTKVAVKDSAKMAREVTEDLKEKASAGTPGVSEYAGLDFSANWKALAELATAMKDLDRSTRLFFISLAFMAVAGATVGLDSIGSGLGKP